MKHRMLTIALLCVAQFFTLLGQTKRRPAAVRLHSSFFIPLTQMKR